MADYWPILKRNWKYFSKIFSESKNKVGDAYNEITYARNPEMHQRDHFDDTEKAYFIQIIKQILNTVEEWEENNQEIVTKITIRLIFQFFKRLLLIE